MIKILHLHTDIKFIIDSKKYQHQDIYNKIIYLGDSSDEVINKLNSLGIDFEIIVKENAAISYIKELAFQFDVVVFNGLCQFNKRVFDVVKDDKITFLRLFGFEAYIRYFPLFISTLTLVKVYPIKLRNGYYSYFRSFYKRYLLKYCILAKFNKDNLFKAFSAILLFNEEEYKELNKYFKLPKLIKVPSNFVIDYSKLNPEKKNKIILGNSRSYWNNHFDVLYDITKVKQNELYEFILLFNYGDKDRYTVEIERFVENRPNLILLEEFLSFENFKKLFYDVSAVVINSYRQHALGNVFIGISYGCKIYLNTRSSTYRWLKEKGVVVYDVETLKDDLVQNNIRLSLEEMKYNLEMFDKCFMNSKENFTSSIVDFVHSKKSIN